MPSREISMKDALDAVASRANGCARRIENIAGDLGDLLEYVSPDPAKDLLRTHIQRLREEVRALNGG
jgi:hypothetical protein